MIIKWRRNNINWKAVDNTCEYYKTIHKFPVYDEYCAWMLEENGIECGNDYIRIVDKEKYLLFLVRWS